MTFHMQHRNDYNSVLQHLYRKQNKKLSNKYKQIQFQAIIQYSKCMYVEYVLIELILINEIEYENEYDTIIDNNNNEQYDNEHTQSMFI